MTPGALKVEAVSFGAIVLAYVLCHGLTARLVTPVQNLIIPEITVFASLVYLPHGVRVLATWMSGLRAVPALAVGALAAELIFAAGPAADLLRPRLLESVLVGAVSAALAFEALRLTGWNFYSGQSRRISWKRLLLVGALASVINSVGQSLVFGGVILPEEWFGVLAVYALGDLIGLFVAMVLLMLVFRWLRRPAARGRP